MSLAFLPEEIESCILEFNPKHRPLFKDTLNKIPLKAMKKRLNVIDHIYQTNNGQVSFNRVMDENLDDREYMAKILSTCNCCVRHSINRPQAYDDYTWHNPDLYPVDQKEHECECKCRHMNRFICRSNPDFSRLFWP